MKRKGKLRLDKGKFVLFLITICLFLGLVNIGVSFVKYPEEHLTTWKKALYNDLLKGDELAVKYYNENYIAKGKYLFGEGKDEYLNLATVVGFDATENGVLLHTDDGNGYYIEK